MLTLTRDEARRALVAHHALDRPLGRGPRGVRAALARLRCIQLDPLDLIGTNADLVVLARVDGIKRGDVWRHLFPGRAFEHFAKERCLLPASAFPQYRARGHRAQTPWWSHGERERRVPAAVVEAVLAEVRKRPGSRRPSSRTTAESRRSTGAAGRAPAGPRRWPSRSSGRAATSS